MPSELVQQSDMIQITPSEEERQREGEGVECKQQPSATSPYILRRIFYASVLIALLLLISFYFDLLQDYDFLSLLLGFVVCIILQFSFLSYYFEEEMRKFKMDEVGILKWKIKLLFGDLNLQHVERKNRIKYYRHESNDSDRLFSDENESIYQNVMTSLRGKEEIPFKEVIDKARQKWSFLEQKITLMEKFLRTVLKQYDSRKSIYNRYKNTLAKMKEREDFREWLFFLKEENNLNNTTYYSTNKDESPHSNPDTLQDEEKKKEEEEKNMKDEENNACSQIKINWCVFHWFASEKFKMNEKEIRDIKMYIVEEFNGLVETVQKAKDNHTKKREKSLADYRSAINEKNAIEKEKDKIISKIKKLQSKLEENRIKRGNEVEGILKDEFDLRLYKIEYENYQIKMSRAKSSELSFSQLLNNQIELENIDLETFLQTFNGKINQYINQMVGYGEMRAPDIKGYIQQLQDIKIKEEYARPKEITDDMQLDLFIERYYNRRKFESSFKIYLIEMLNLFKELKNNHHESKWIMEEYKGKFEKISNSETKGEGIIQTEFNGARLHYYASSVNDQKILRMFETINLFQDKITGQMSEYIDWQIRAINKFEEEVGSTIGKDMKRLQQEFKRKEDQIKKAKKKGIIGQVLASVVKDAQETKTYIYMEVKNYSENIKIMTYLISMMKSMIESQEEYQQYATEVDAEEKYELQSRQKSQGEDRRMQKYTAFLNLMSKYQSNEFDDDSLMQQDTFSLFGKDNTYDEIKQSNEGNDYVIAGMKGKDTMSKLKNKQTQKTGQLVQYKQNHQKSIEMVNKLLGVLFNEWCNSQFFHQFVKEELLVSLNRKRPGVVENLNIQYFKIIEKQKNVNPVKKIKVHNSEIFRCLFDLTLNFKGKIAVQIGTKLKIGSKPPLQIKLLIKQFECPIRVCFTPFSLGKSYASLLERPRLSIDYSVTIGGYNLTKIPFFTQIIKTYIVLKLRKKMLWPKRMTLSVPLAFKSTLDIAIQQRLRYERDREKLQKKYR